ncbi:homoserine O-acetyltransferase [Corynebacterium frankenforstense]|uniref:homoserine O-acetyltransferase MetX n=1 Tax=Corynebacterium frankenforstense TaxID=1230998 RepID=UPI0026F3779B|nr:homoserine O-acetyltransferase [Corynebacterium frankenforstense]
MTPNLARPGVLARQPIGDFRTEAGATIPEVHVAYQRWGSYRVNADGSSNVVLVEHALTGDSDAASWWGDLVGPNKAIDTDRYCVICTNVIGGCQGTTGPGSAHPADGRAWGSRFPAVSIRDQVEVEKQFLDSLGITSVFAVIGGSMGGARSLEWSYLHPEVVNAAAVFAVSARASAWQIGIQGAQIAAIENDPNWHGGDYYDTGATPNAGLATARRIAHLTYRGELEIDERFGTTPQTGENPLGAHRSAGQRFAVESYLDYQARKLTARFDAGTYAVLTDSLNRHDIGRGRGGLNRALSKITVPTLVTGVDTDILYPYHQQEHLSRNLGNLLGMAKIVSPVGHDAFLTETRQMDRILRNFFEQVDPDAPGAAGRIEYHI